MALVHSLTTRRSFEKKCYDLSPTRAPCQRKESGNSSSANYYIFGTEAVYLLCKAEEEEMDPSWKHKQQIRC